MTETLNKVDRYLNRITEGKTLNLPNNTIDLGEQPDGERKYSLPGFHIFSLGSEVLILNFVSSSVYQPSEVT